MRADMIRRLNGPMVRSEVARASVPELARLARHLAEPSRAAMLLALMDGRAWTVGELAVQAGVARNTASEHVSRLAEAGLVDCIRQGRHSYVTLAGQQVADLVESMGLLADIRPATSSLHGQRHDQELAAGRTCYRHLAGRLGVGLADAWLAGGMLTESWTLTATGMTWFDERDIPIPDGKGPALRPCLDWTQRRPHAAGPLATALTDAAFARGWVVRGRHPRSVHLMPCGAAALA